MKNSDILKKSVDIHETNIVCAIVHEVMLPVWYSKEQYEYFMEYLDTLSIKDLTQVKVWCSDDDYDTFLYYGYNWDTIDDNDEYFWMSQSIPRMDERLL